MTDAQKHRALIRIIASAEKQAVKLEEDLAALLAHLDLIRNTNNVLIDEPTQPERKL